MGAELPLVCDREENSAVWEMDSRPIRDLLDIRRRFLVVGGGR